MAAESSSPVNRHTPRIPFRLVLDISIALVLGIALALVFAGTGKARPGIISIASADANGNQGLQPSHNPDVSKDGRFVVFHTASNLVAADTQSNTDVYMKDTRTGALTLISANSSGAVGNGDSQDAAITGNGRFVTFSSDATNLISGDKNYRRDIFVRDNLDGKVYRVSLDSSFGEANSMSDNPSISDNGRYVVFDSDATDLVTGDNNNKSDVFMRDRVNNTTIRISSSSAGNEANHHSLFPEIAADGRYVVFESLASDLAAGDTNNRYDIFLKDTSTGSTTICSTSTYGILSNFQSAEATISANGRYVFFRSGANNLVTNDTNPGWDIFMKDTNSGYTTMVSVDANSGVANGSSWDPHISGDGRYLAFFTDSTNLAGNDTNGKQDILVKDVWMGTVHMVSKNTAGTLGNDHSGECGISGDGRYVVFESDANNLLADANGTRDIFITPTGRQSHFTWYDNLYSANWLLLGHRAGVSSQLWYDSYIGGQRRDPGSIGGAWLSGQVPSGNMLTPRYSGLIGGPVQVSSLSGEQGLISQRMIFGGKSFEEVVGTETADLSDRYYWTWYDQASPGMQNWVLVANPSANPVYYEIRIAGVLRSSGTINPVSYVTPQFPGVSGGPVEVQAWVNSWKIQPAMVIASQRVLSNYGTSFNEVMGTPAGKLSNHYMWTWYDQLSAGCQNWVLLANPNGSSVYYEVKIYGTVYASGTLGAGQIVTPTFPGLRGGAVEVLAWTSSGKGAPADIIASQRVLWGPSFDETPGYPVSELSNDYLWTWYDQQSAGSSNWVLVFNPNLSTIYYDIYVGSGQVAGGTIAGGQSVTPQVPGAMGGPVEVKAWADAGKTSPVNVFASQRVLWNGYFNETPGTVLD